MGFNWVKKRNISAEVSMVSAIVPPQVPLTAVEEAQGLKALNEFGLYIPKPELVMGSLINHNESSLFAYWNPSITAFLNYSPEYWLFRYTRRTKNMTEGSGIRQLQSGFFHGSHQNGIKYPNDAFYGGANTDAKGHLLPGRNTEWAVLHKPYELTNLTINPDHYLTNTEGATTVKKKAVFKIAIVINNPDKSSLIKKVFGPMSDEFAICKTDIGTEDEGYMLRRT